MPKLIDHDRRAEEIVDATWRVLASRGVAAASVRNVAAEAGIATASLRRAFPTQSALLAATLEALGGRAEARIRALPDAGSRLDHAVAMLAQTLPLDEERTVEMRVYLALGTANLQDDAVTTAFRELRDGIDALCAIALELAGVARPPEEMRLQIVHLAALVDGLAIQLLQDGDGEAALAVLREHLRALAAASPAPAS